MIPNSRWHDKRTWIMVSPAALILTAILKPHFDLHLIDCNGEDLSLEGLGQRLADLAPDAVLVSCLSVEYARQSHAALAIAKQSVPGVTTVLGGVYPTVLPESALEDENVDCIFLGHAEERAVPFLTALLSGGVEAVADLPGVGFRSGGQLVIRPVASYISDVKEMVKPDYSLIDLSPYINQRTHDYQYNSKVPMASLVSSYGCPFNCIFCATRTVSGRRVVFRPAEDVLEEIGYLVDTYGVQDLSFIDDCLLADRERIEVIMRGMAERWPGLRWKVVTLSAWHLDDELMELMAACGCEQFTISVESGSQRVLKEIIRKPLKLEIVPPIVRKARELGITIGGNFVIGFPGETFKEIRDSFAFAEECDFDFVNFHIATPLPGTDLYRVAQEQGLLPDDFSFTDPRYFGFGYAFIGTDEFTPFELMVLRAFEWDRINFSTDEKIAKIADLVNMTVDELNEHRRQTRRKCGIHVPPDAPVEA
ncbi:MAG: radical SAM protein [Actinobacteria bacterium]|nr:MAG: radical SAM protein [Actinomycetota bacterium]